MPEQSPVFIVGAPRSGTTMLQYRLRNLPSLSFPTGESHFFIPLYRSQNNFGDLRQLENVRAVLQMMLGQSRQFLEEHLRGLEFDLQKLAAELHASQCDTVPKIINGLFTKNARGEGKSRWGEKTPYYVMHMDKLLEWFPKAQFIHLVRDGRDVALSLFERRHDFGVYNTFYAAEYWESYIQKGRFLSRKMSPNQYIELHYEELLSAPEETMRSLCDFLGESYSETVFSVSSPKNRGKTPLVYEPFKAENVGKWRTALTRRQVRAFESVAGKSLMDLGYELAGYGQSPGITTKAAYRLHNTLSKSYWRWKRGRS